MLNLINQLIFARSEFKKGFSGVTEEEGSLRLMPVNSIGWIVGHLAWHEQYYWLTRSQGKILIPELIDQVGFGKPASIPSLKKMISYWETITHDADDYLFQMKESDLLGKMVVKGKELPFNMGTMISRVIYHYWYHNGEMQALRQLMGHSDLPEFVSDDIETVGSYYLD